MITYKLIIIDKISYNDALILQSILQNKVLKNNDEQYILALSHNDVITRGKRGFLDTLKYDENYYKVNNIELIKTDRGGLATYHGQGQLVIYFIFNLFDLKLGIKDFVAKIEESIIKTLEYFSIISNKLEGFRGVFVNNNKIAAIGMHVTHGVTKHGIALNISTNLDRFSLFTPCGLKDKGVTSIEHEINKTINFSEVLELLIKNISDNLGVKIAR